MVRRTLLAGFLVAVLVGSWAAAAQAAQTVVTIGFDDGLATQFQNRALLSSRGLKATYYINTAKLGQPGYMTWDQVAAMAGDGHEIGGHTLDHANLTTLTATQQRTEICDDRAALVAHGFSNPISFAYPYGADNASAQQIAQSCGYRSARTTRGIDFPTCDVCAETIPPRFAFSSRAVQANSTAGASDLELVVQNAENAGGGWLQLVLHDICDGCDFYGLPAPVLGTFFDWLRSEQAAGRVAVMTAGQVMSGASPPPPPPDTTAPVVALTAPADGATASGPTTLSADASDNVGVTRVDFLVNGTVVASDASAPYTATWDPSTVTGSSATIQARAVDAAGNTTTTNARTVTISRPDATPPTVSLTAPVAGAQVTGPTTLSATAGDNVGVTRVDFLVNGTVVASDASAPYTATWDPSTVTGSSATIQARAVDAAGNSTTTAARSVTIVRSDTTPPTVALTAPANGARVSGTVTMSANASDAGGLARVEFLVNGTVVGTDTTAPYSVPWNTATTSGTTATIAARAVDRAGNTTTSATRSVTITRPDTTPPKVSITSPANNATISGAFTVTVSASDNVGVTQVRFLSDGVLLQTDTSAPYSARGSLSRGTHTITAQAVDAAGNVATSAPVTVRIR